MAAAGRGEKKRKGVFKLQAGKPGLRGCRNLPRPTISVPASKLHHKKGKRGGKEKKNDTVLHRSRRSFGEVHPEKKKREEKGLLTFFSPARRWEKGKRERNVLQNPPQQGGKKENRQLRDFLSAWVKAKKGKRKKKRKKKKTASNPLRYKRGRRRKGGSFCKPCQQE